MNRSSRLTSLALSTILLVGAAGCTSSEDTTNSTTGAQSSPAASAPAASAPDAPAAATATPLGDDAYEYEGVTVTGAKGAAPTITLADDFGPATELGVADIFVGEGTPVAAGATLTVHYLGVGEQSRDVFDTSWEGGQPATFPLDNVIEGWRQGMLGMQPGGRRLLIIPGSLAYGPEGRPDVIGPDETLVFVVDLVEQVPAA